MSRDFTDDIDDCSEAIVGHTNWGFADSTLHKTVESIMSKRNGDSPKSDRIEYVVIFYKDEMEDEPHDEV
tara:strand:+ start:321 stop:530 length:210 start_codon:yes stop_codon:yes gene_type:complete